MTMDFEDRDRMDVDVDGLLNLPTTVNTHGAAVTLSDAPEVGDTLENCRLIAELGYGSSGRAFLARQPALADRPIVLKVTNVTHEEHLNLARLQHTNIMPLYWASTHPYTGLRILAMPYLARTTLSRLLENLRSLRIDDWNGQRIFEILQQDQDGVPVQIPAQEHAAQVLRGSTWIDFVLRMGQTLAEALAFAHQRNLLHLDVKPSNILITPDGQPLLLDLDVACQPIPEGAVTIPWLGGTPFYMSPEQQQAMEALSLSKPIPARVDERSDVYTLGMVLYVALGGALDEQQRPDPARLPLLNPKVSREIVDIIGRCIAEKPSQRYPNCTELAADLELQRLDLPLRGVRDRLSDRWQKWRRRHPLGLSLAVLLIFCLITVFAGFFSQFLR
jgi:eukaryotic-like serine/threonine-protein kinase